MTKGFKFTKFIKAQDIKGPQEFINIPIDNGTLEVYIPTPKNWKCKRKGCTTRIYHTHTTYGSLQ